MRMTMSNWRKNIMLPLTSLLVSDLEDGMTNVIHAVREGDGSYSHGEPIWVRQDDAPPGLYWLEDGAHRVAEAWLRGDREILADIEYDVDFPDEPSLGPPFFDFSAPPPAPHVPIQPTTNKRDI